MKVESAYTKILIVSLTLFLTILKPLFYAQAAEEVKLPTSAQGQDLQEEERLIKILDKETEIATKTRLNSDYVPGLVTVLYGEELKAQGMLIVWEALSTVPGIELSIDQTGGKELIIRGIGRTPLSGKVKVLLNGVSMNSAMVGRADPVMNMPIEQVDRIEIIRGPGSVLYGEYAFSGLVNVITKKEGQMLFTEVTSRNVIEGGGLFSYKNANSGFNISLNAAGSGSADAHVTAAKDRLYGMGMGDISYAPGPTNEDNNFGSVLLNMSWKDLTAKLQLLSDGRGDHFGLSSFLPPPEHRIVMRNKYLTSFVNYTFKIESTLNADVSFGIMDYTQDINNAQSAPPGFLGSVDGYKITSHYEELQIKGGVDLKYTGVDSHTFILSTSVVNTNIVDAWWDLNWDPDTARPLPNTQRFTGDKNFIDKGRNRFLNSYSAQDEIRINKDVNVTLNLRYDNYSDFRSSIMPRLASVYRLTDNHILKAQYARAFRPPSFYEMKRSYELKPETIDTYEVSYIYKGDKTKGILTLFYSNLDDMIIFVVNKYKNIEPLAKRK
ncbi:MAG: TonB-dependent receptor [Nitrospirae bacterium]|nr:TonB-dependent receptor [Nitrospirota bacterium]